MTHERAQQKEQVRSANNNGKQFKELRTIYCSLHTITLIICDDGAFYFKCDCKHYCFSGYLCAHVLVCMQKRGLVNLREYVEKLEPVKSGGRPLKRTDCLKTMSDSVPLSGPELKKFKGLNMIGAEVRGVGEYNGLLTGYLIDVDVSLGDEQYCVRFEDANPPVDAWMTIENFMKGCQAFKQFKERVRSSV